MNAFYPSSPPTKPVSSLECGPSGTTVLKSYNDWNNLNFVFLPTVNAQAGKVTSDSTKQQEKELSTKMIKDAIGAKNRYVFIPPPNPALVDTFNTGQSIPLKIQIKDINGNFLTQEQVTLLVQKEINPPPPNTVVGLFVYDNVNNQYKIVWQTPSGNPGVGTVQAQICAKLSKYQPGKA